MRGIVWKLLTIMAAVLSLAGCSKEQESMAWENMAKESIEQENMGQESILQGRILQKGASSDMCRNAGHDMEIQWYGAPPDCTKGSYRAAVCKRCGWVDEKACGSVEPSGHVLQAKELFHGNCREDTIIVYTCSVCGKETGYDRYPEADEHQWIFREITVWDETAKAFVTDRIQCCERCNFRP